MIEAISKRLWLYQRGLFFRPHKSRGNIPHKGNEAELFLVSSVAKASVLMLLLAVGLFALLYWI